MTRQNYWPVTLHIKALSWPVFLTIHVLFAEPISVHGIQDMDSVTTRKKMLTAEYRINGSLIGYLYIHNLGIQEKGKYLYEYEFYKVGTGEVSKGTVRHKRSDGFMRLIQETYKDRNDKRRSD